jgi:hypothetical protein
MKLSTCPNRIVITLLLFLSVASAYAQNVGIGTQQPIMPLHISADTSALFMIENKAPLGVGETSAMYFRFNASGNGKYGGAIKAIGTSLVDARLAFFTYASSSPAVLLERLTILDNGNIGLGKNNPTSKLDVVGGITATTTITAGTNLTVGANATIGANVNIGNGITVGGNAIVGGNIITGGNVTVLGDKGIVRSVSATQMKIKRLTVAFSAVGLPAGTTIDPGGFFNFSEDFTAVSVLVGQPYNGTGDYVKVLVVPTGVDVVNDRCQFRLTNTTNGAITFNSIWEIVLIGY